jgi:hypothetical protein
MLLKTGIMMGVAALAVARHGTALGFWGFVAPHGVIELPAIFISSGAGLMLGYALVNPGEYSRRTALALAGREAVQLIFGVVAMLVVAGIIEAFFSPTLLPPPLKLLAAAIIFTAEAGYFIFAGRGEEGVQVFRRSGVQDRQDRRDKDRTPEYLNTRTPEHPVAKALVGVRPVPGSTAGRPGWWRAGGGAVVPGLLLPDETLDGLLEEMRRTIPVLERMGYG